MNYEEMESDNRINYYARVNYRNDRRVFGIKQADRRSHLYVIGKTGTGKSTLFETMIRQDISAGAGLTLLDPHGDLVERVLTHVPENRRSDLIYFNVPDLVHPLGFNPLEKVPPEKRALAASGLIEVFKKIWADSWGPRLEHILRNAFLALLDQREATLADVSKLLDDSGFRRRAALNVANPHVRFRTSLSPDKLWGDLFFGEFCVLKSMHWSIHLLVSCIKLFFAESRVGGKRAGAKRAPWLCHPAPAVYTVFENYQAGFLDGAIHFSTPSL